MIAGIGIDLVRVERVEKLVREFGEKLKRKLLTSRERKVLLTKFNEIESLAARIAAKEAVIKALGASARISFKNIEILGSSSLKVKLKGQAALRFAALKGKNVFVSISHEAGMAIAIAIVEGQQ